MPANTAWVDVPSPFVAEQLAVQVVGDLSTRYQHRELSLAPIAYLMARQYQPQPGNYLVFVSSYDYLEKLVQYLYPQVPMWTQTRRMDEVARDEFLASFVLEGKGIGFAMLGGAFAEGIKLPGQRLIGAFIATWACHKSIRSTSRSSCGWLTILSFGRRVNKPIFIRAFKKSFRPQAG